MPCRAGSDFCGIAARYFYRYTPPRPLEEIEADVREIEKDILRMLASVTGGK